MFFACASVGPDSLAVEMVSSSPLKRHIGRFAYVAAMGSLLCRWPRHRLRLSANGASWECEAVYIAKGCYYAGAWSCAQARWGWPVACRALKRARRREIFQFYWRMLSGGDVTGHSNVIAFHARRCRCNRMRRCRFRAMAMCWPCARWRCRFTTGRSASAEL
jgi:hypothetical protein